MNTSFQQFSGGSNLGRMKLKPPGANSAGEFDRVYRGGVSVKIFIIIGAALAGLSVAFGAFGAHILERMLEPRYLEIWEKGLHTKCFMRLGS